MKKEIPWRENNGMVFDVWDDDAVVEVEYRDGRRATGNEPWTFQGWYHTGFSTDIVKYRQIN